MVMFSKPIDPLSLTASQFGLFDYDTDYRISGTIAIAANAMSATFTPSEPLLPNTYYVLALPRTRFTSVRFLGLHRRGREHRVPAATRCSPRARAM